MFGKPVIRLRVLGTRQVATLGMNDFKAYYLKHLWKIAYYFMLMGYWLNIFDRLCGATHKDASSGGQKWM